MRLVSNKLSFKCNFIVYSKYLLIWCVWRHLLVIILYAKRLYNCVLQSKMPGIRCAVYGCSNNLITVRKRGEDIKFHAFPKGKNLGTNGTNTIRLEWINRCKRSDKFNPDTYKICSVHFTEQSYERDMQNELLGLPLKKKLKSTAVPTLHLPNRKNTTVTDAGLFSNVKNNENRSEPPETSTMHHNVLCEDSYKLKYEELLVQHTRLQNNYSSLIQESKKEIKRLTDLLRYYKKKNSRNPNTMEKSSNLLSNVLTSNQIALVAKSKKRVNWNQEELSTAFILRYYSKKCYLHLRNNLHYPLPSLCTLKKWTSQVHVKQGLLKDVNLPHEIN